jgi:hypothetical protein
MRPAAVVVRAEVEGLVRGGNAAALLDKRADSSIRRENQSAGISPAAATKPCAK